MIKIILILFIISININISLQQQKVSLKHVHIIAHSHCDPGWLETFEGYYRSKVRNIISNVVKELNINKERKFIWSETSYFERWYTDKQVPQNLKDSFKKHLMETHQIEFVNGAWVQQDEGNPDLIQSINQITMGHEYLRREFNIIPRIAWQIDPFGHSATFAALAALTGFEALVINRIPFNVKNGFKSSKHMEFVWNTSNVGAAHHTEMFTHVLHTHYSAPPGFDWEERGPPINERNVEQRAKVFINLMKSRSLAYRTSHLLVPFGDDFKFQRAKIQFDNMDKLMKEINSNPQKYENIKVKYSTVSEYFDAIRKDSPDTKFPIHSGDFFPYADNGDSYWTGYFTTRPQLKSLSRRLQDTIRSAEIIQAMLGPSDYAFNELDNARQQSGIMMHHDAITGTCKVKVMNDYLSRMKKAFTDADTVLRRLVSRASNLNTVNSLLKIDRSIYLPIYNSLAWERSEIVKLKTKQSNIRVLDMNGKTLPVQMRPIWTFGMGIHSNEYEAVFIANVPPISVAVYQVIVVDNSESDHMPKLEVLSNKNSNKKKRGDGNILYDVLDKKKRLYIDNDLWSIEVNKENGLIESIQQRSTGVTVQLNQNFGLYRTMRSGAYLFRPQGKSVPIKASGINEIIIQHGKLLSTVWARYAGYDIEYSLFHQGPVELRNEIHQTLHVKAAPNEEIVLNHQFKENIQLNTHDGLAFQRRSNQPKQPLAANFYPMIGGVEVEGKNFVLSIVNEHSMAVGNPVQKHVEIMMQRSLTRDDGRGMGEPTRDASVAEINLWFSLTAKKSHVLHNRRLIRLNHPLNVFSGPPNNVKSAAKPDMNQYLPNKHEVAETQKLVESKHVTKRKNRRKTTSKRRNTSKTASSSDKHDPTKTKDDDKKKKVEDKKKKVEPNKKKKAEPNKKKKREEKKKTNDIEKKKKKETTDFKSIEKAWSTVFKKHGAHLSESRKTACIKALTNMEAALDDANDLLDSGTLLDGGIKKWRTRQDIRYTIRKYLSNSSSPKHHHRRLLALKQITGIYAPLGVDGFPSDVHLLTLSTQNPKSDKILLRIQSIGKGTNMDADAKYMFVDKGGVSIQKLQPLTLAMNHELKANQYVLDRPRYLTSKKRDVDLSLDHLAGISKLESQNTEEEGVFISQAARDEEKAASTRRHLLSVKSTSTTKFQLDGHQIRTFLVTIKRTNPAHNIKYTPSLNSETDISMFPNIDESISHQNQYKSRRSLHVEISRSTTYHLLFTVLLVSVTLGLCLVYVVFRISNLNRVKSM